MLNGLKPPEPPETPNFQEIFERMESRLEGMPPPPPPVDYGPYYTPPMGPRLPPDYGPYYTPPPTPTGILKPPGMAAPPQAPPPPLGIPPPTELVPPGGEQRLPWSYYQRVGRMVDMPENFWDWVGENYPISPSWKSKVEQARPTVDLKTEFGGYYAGEGEIVSKYPFRAGAKYVWKHELGHYMDDSAGPEGGHLSDTPEWQEAVRRWARDPRWKKSGERTWRYITGGHPRGSREKPAYHEGYANAATYPFSDVPPYIRPFYPWRDWKELEASEKRAQQRDMLMGEPRRRRDRAYRDEAVIQHAIDMGMDASDFERMWGGNYQEHPIPSMVFAYHGDQYESQEQARAEWEQIPQADREMALEWFFDGIWPLVKDDPGEWQAEKDFLDFMGITVPGEQQAQAHGGRPPWQTYRGMWRTLEPFIRGYSQLRGGE